MINLDLEQLILSIIPKQFTLGKQVRLKSRKSIEQLFVQGLKFNVGAFRVHYMEVVNASSALQFGVGVSAKNFKRAVDRNRIKRLTRESYRLQKKQLEEKIMNSRTQVNIFFI